MTLYWSYDSKGHYIVKSRYKCALQNAIVAQVNRGEDAITFELLDSHQNLWKMIWKLNIPPKVRILSWRLARNILPTRARLLSKNMQVGNGCYFCGHGNEDMWHLFVECVYTRAVLGLDGFSFQVTQ